jgi:polyhydroxybutyrate depolymerase
MRKMQRRALLGLIGGAGLAVLTGCRRATASSAAAAPAHPTTPARASQAGRSMQQVTTGGVTRRYVRYEPPGLDAATPAPLVLVLHGRGGSGTIAERLYDFRQQSDTNGFVVAYPDALGDPLTWHAGLGLGGAQADDVEFVRALVAQEAALRPIDPARTFVCGHSSGAMMTYRLAAEASDLFPAVGAVAGTIGVRRPNGAALTIPQPQRPVSVIHFHGTDDALVPYGGGTGRAPVTFLSVADSIAFWVANNGCDPTPTTETIGVSRRETYAGGRDGSEVTLWTIEGGGHGWPRVGGRESVGVSPAGIAATALIWAFFAAHGRALV